MSKMVLYDYAMKLVGLPYRWGGDDLIEGLDCSGLVIELLQSQGVLPRGYDAPAKALYRELLRRQGRTIQKPQFGACIFFGKIVDQITHVGICLNDSQMLEAGGGDSSVIDRTSAARKNAYVRIRPVSWRGDSVAIVMPKYTWGE